MVHVAADQRQTPITRIRNATRPGKARAKWNAIICFIGHDEKKNASWVSWMHTNWPAIDRTCNTHTDPGQYWDWPHFMALINTNPASAPVVTNQPQDLAVNLGDSATSNVGATGTSPLSYQWLFNGAGIAGASASNYVRTNVHVADLGSYSVVVSNQLGSVTSSNALLLINGPPLITSQPQSQVVSVGQKAVFTVGVFTVGVAGTPPFSYQW